uniref:Uncharacterized protein n=1 Tax=Ochrobactrum phage ORM_20 TaxID=2985243 RepID=A0A9N6WSR8_9VIRU|nr:hypothetical protein ORM20_00226 [Ochrobactrum phage ORM_20]
MQQNAFEQFQNQTRLREQQRFYGKKAHSQIRSFMDGNPVPPSGVLDNFVWLIGGGYKNILIGGEIPEALVKRMERPITSLEKFFADYLQYFFRKDFTRARIEQLYVKFTNEMESEDVAVVYSATSGTLELDPDLLERYAGNRRFPNGTPIFQREVYEKLKAEEAAEFGKLETTEEQPSPEAPKPEVSAPAASQEAPEGEEGYDPLELGGDEEENGTEDPVDPAPTDNPGKAPRKPKAKVDEPKKERKVRVPRQKKEKA